MFCCKLYPDLEFLRSVEGGLGFSEVGSECLKGLIQLSKNGIGNM